MRKLLLFCIGLTMLSGAASAQSSGGLKGRVTDKATKYPIAFANIVVEIPGGKQVCGGTTDMDGYYIIKPLNPGEYDVKTTYVGYKPLLIQKVLVVSGQISELNIELEVTTMTLSTYEVKEYCIPLIKKDQISSGGTMTDKEIRKMSGRSASSVSATVGGVFKVDGGSTSIRGARVDGTVTYIDGVKVRGSSSLPRSGIDQITLITGGTPAQYGEGIGSEGQKAGAAARNLPPIILPVEENKAVVTIMLPDNTGTSIPSQTYPTLNYQNTNDYNTETYIPIKENEFKSPLNEPLSTFSIDVDRAAYGNVRRYLYNNMQVPYDAVRYEEMINYFDYDYPQPTNGHPFSITVEGGRCPWNPKNHLVLIGLKGENMNEMKIPANNLVFLLDVSGSMSTPEKLPLVKQSLKILVEKLRPEDHVAIVVYAGAAGCVLESTPGDEKSIILRALDNLQAGGSTAGGAGIELAYKIAKENYIENGNNRVILATDGDFNVGPSSDADMVNLIEAKRNQGIFLTILGFGMGNYKDSKMEQISNAGNGNYAYIDNILEAKKMFGTELWGTLYTIAKDVKIQVEFNPAKVKKYRLIGYEDRLLEAEDFNNDKKDAGEIGCGHTVTALYEIVPVDNAVENEQPLVDPLKYQKSQVVDSSDFLTVKFRYKKPNEDKSILLEQTLKPEDMVVSNNIIFASAVVEFAMLLRNSEYKGCSSFKDILIMARKAKGADPYEYRSDFIKMVEMAELLYK